MRPRILAWLLLLALLPSLAQAQPVALDRARTRRLTGRGLTIAGIGMLVLAVGVGIPLIEAGSSESNYRLSLIKDGIIVSALFGSLGGSALTVGPILWQAGAHDEAALRDGRSLEASARHRRVAGIALLTV